jgi:hypothetical protein
MIAFTRKNSYLQNFNINANETQRKHLEYLCKAECYRNRSKLSLFDLRYKTFKIRIHQGASRGG